MTTAFATRMLSVADALVGFVPGLGSVITLRDLIAVIMRLAKHPEKRKEVEGLCGQRTGEPQSTHRRAADPGRQRRDRHQRQRRDPDQREHEDRDDRGPRLNGKARQDYMFATSNLNGLDATYAPTFEEWMRVESRTPWSFYANGVYLEVAFTREPTLTDPAKPGSYLLTFNIKTETEYFRGYAGPDNRLRWKEVVPQELVKVAALRAGKEAELRAKGVAIDESYQDPPVPVMK
jgi:hypothetical protein